MLVLSLFFFLIFSPHSFFLFSPFFCPSKLFKNGKRNEIPQISKKLQGCFESLQRRDMLLLSTLLEPCKKQKYIFVICYTVIMCMMCGQCLKFSLFIFSVSISHICKTRFDIYCEIRYYSGEGMERDEVACIYTNTSQTDF
jgi:hypothetical protein